MARYLRLIGPDHFDKVTDTYFVVAHQIYEAQPGAIRQCPKERFNIESAVLCHNNRF
jgi:hypothetical protein